RAQWGEVSRDRTPGRASAYNRRGDRSPVALRGDLARGRAAADAHLLATLDGGWGAQRLGLLRDGTGGGLAHSGRRHWNTGAHIPRMGQRPRQRLPLIAIEESTLTPNTA